MTHLSTATLLQLSKIIHDRAGLVIGTDKGYLLRNRLEPVLKEFELGGYEALATELQSVGPRARLFERVIDAMTTKETAFFRDSWFFEALASKVLPERIDKVLGGHSRRHQLRIWSSATATGQEAYSLAMLVCELAGKSDLAGKTDLAGGRQQVTVFASDISSEAVRTGEAGRYTDAEIGRGIAGTRFTRHLVRDGKGWVVAEPVRRLVRFRAINLLHVPNDIGHFDLILCRNVLIYFDDQTRRQVCAALSARLHEGGWFGIGSAESLHGISGAMTPVPLGRAVMYRAAAGAGDIEG
jgi:chemotaxis protein methyltransferase CheR